jgi:predicted nucleic acid-binding protein
MIDLRCPECNAWMQMAVGSAEAAELDRIQADGRRELVDAYHQSVVDSMESLAFCLHIALDQDLVGADDFAPRRAA